MKQQHHPKDAKTYVKGANRDIEKEFINLDDGSYIDACNMRPINTEGDNGALSKMSGEEVLYNRNYRRCGDSSLISFSDTYKCIGTIEVKNKVIEFWADEAGSDDPFVRIDGLLVLKSSQLPIGSANPLQMDKNESCVGGEIYATDYVNAPLFFNVDDLLTNAGYYSSSDCTEKYFSEFNLSESQLSLEGHLNVPRFVELQSSGSGTVRDRNGSEGLPVGTYSYAIRYVDQTGNATNIGMFSPTIPVVKNFSPDTKHYPYARTLGDAPDESNATRYGIRLKVRVNNLNNYERVEVIRVRWTSGTAIGTPPEGEIILKIPLDEGEVGSFDVEDASINSIETVTDEVTSSQLGGIKRAKSVRFFENKLYLGNIEYESKDVSADEVFPSGSANIYPTLEFMGKAGHNDPYNYAYHKSYMSTDETGFGLLFLDNEGTRSFVVPIPGGEEVEMPSRRDAVSQDTIDTSIKGLPEAALSTGGFGYCHEVFDMEDSIGRTDVSSRCAFVNISQEGWKCGAMVDDGQANFKECTDGEPISQTLQVGTNCGGWIIRSNKIGFAGLHPYTPADSNWDNLNFNPNQVLDTGDEKIKLPGRWMFAPNYYAKGFAIEGIAPPKWASSFSIVRTKPAQKVQAQGMASWSLNSAGNNTSNVSKNSNKVWFYASDADEKDSLGINPQLFEDINNGIGTGEYTLKMESPLGFGSDYYNFNEGAGGSLATFGLDLISHVRLMKDSTLNPKFTPEEGSSMGTGDGDNRYVSFGKWRRGIGDQLPEGFPSQTNPFTFKITGIKLVKGVDTPAGERGGHFWEISLNKDIYKYVNLGSTPHDFAEDSYRNFHEPFYIASILRENNGIDTSPQTQEYISTGHSQQLRSLVAVSPDDNAAINVDLVDERWEDCIPDLLTSSSTQLKDTRMPGQVANYYNLKRFVSVEDKDGKPLKYMNATFEDVDTINTILSGIAANGSYKDATNTDGATIHGIYKHIDTNGNQRFRLIFDTNGWKSGVNTGIVGKEAFIPNKDSKIYVDYDKRIPIRFFGGDTFIGENVHAIYDAKYKSDGTPENDGNTHKINVGLPYRDVTPNKRIYMVQNARNKLLTDNIQSSTPNLKHGTRSGGYPARLRQWLLMYTIESRNCSPYFYGNTTDKATLDTFFPITHYRLRPHKWDNEELLDTEVIDPAYEAAYGDETKYWQYGGFRFRPLANHDYSQYNNFGTYSSKPKTGFTEETLFCTRVIWSEEKPVNVQDSPNVRSFPALNIYDISDDTGEIKYLYDSDSSKGNNLFAFTEDGTVMLLTDKRILSQLNGGELAAIESPERGIQKQIWLSKVIGMSDEMWRSAAEYSNIIYFANLQSVYAMKGTELVDIGRAKYHNRIYYDFLQNLKSGYESDLTGVYNELHQEYWITFNDEKNNAKIPSGAKVTVNYTAPSAGFIGQIRTKVYNGNLVENNGNLGLSGGEYCLIDNKTTDLDKFLLGGNTGELLLNSINLTIDELGNEVVVSDPVNDIDYTLVPGKSYIITPVIEEINGQRPRVSEFTVEETANLYKGEKEQRCVTVMYSKVNGQWIGTNSHDFDRFLSFDNRLFGMRDAETYELNKGDKIYDAPIEAYVMNASVGTASRKSSTQNIKGDASMDKEFIRIRLSSDNKPDSIEFFETEDQMDSNYAV